MCSVGTSWLYSALVIAPLVCGALGCSTGNPGASYADTRADDPRRHPYIIGVSDLLRVAVWKDVDLTTDASVRPDGTITVPLIGEVVARGRTAVSLQAEITRRLSVFTMQPVVTVAVVEVNSYHFTVAGEVEHPGMFTSKYYVTLSEAVALAGGPTRYGSTNDMMIVRAGKRIPIDYDAILSGKSSDQDLVILPGDAIRVP
ncbi:MAG TPA: polysaccharide biosynthesis/export family protein [Polyangiaceae bacterium]|nr:polysaccharide biosynthesis/export family protein [Polyangiaceae bacterium]